MKNILIIFICFITISLNAQEVNNSFFTRKNQHSFSFEPIAVSYDYTYRFSELFGVGVRLKTGVGFRFPLLSSYEYFEYIDLMTIQIQYRLLLPEYFHLDIGPQLSIGTMDGFNNSNPLNYGLNISGFYHYKRLQLGLRLDGVFYTEHASYDYEIESINKTYFELLFIPIVIGFTF